jgi:hypothetical protein
MESKKHIVDAEAKLPSGNYVKGPITTIDDVTYHFRNVFSDLDFYLYMRRSDDGWYQSGGPEIQWPQQMIDELGAQIDNVLG